jgi:MinD superfamily P-loop ATPase
MAKDTPEIDQEKCLGCGDCASWCPKSAVGLVNGKATIVKPEACSYCTECEAICSAGAIRCPFEIVLVKRTS